ncbi:MAG: hypothetical protein JWN56_161 [Sphingobacteriales bacterium]|nr:hypothetical protein [Sphingobacteriales bacterium]
MKKQEIKNYSFFYKNGLTLVFITLTIFSLLGQAYSGWKEHNKELAEEHSHELKFSEYLTTGHFIEATFENWESEFLQMAMYVILTVKLRQLGSSESKKLGEKEEVDREPKPHADAPWPVKKGGFILTLYKNSLSLAFIILFFISFALHAYGSLANYNVEQKLKGLPTETMSEFIVGSKLWFESFQNWQSEFLSVAAIVFLSIYLRQYGSPESKPVDAPNWETD